MNKYFIKDLQPGDLFTSYICRMEGGASKGPGVPEIPENLQNLVFMGNVYNTSMGHALYEDGTPVGMPFSDHDIVSITPGAGADILQTFMMGLAIEVGRFHLQNYVNHYNTFPVKPGTGVKISHTYPNDNKKLGIRNNHKVLNSKTLEFASLSEDGLITTVTDLSTGKTADAATVSIMFKNK